VISVALQHGVPAAALAKSIARIPESLEGPAVTPASLMRHCAERLGRAQHQSVARKLALGWMLKSTTAPEFTTYNHNPDYQNCTVRRWRLCPLRCGEGRYRPLHAVSGAGSRAFRHERLTVSPPV
jgi:hypothetical protein